jgi:hypothetical protein
MAITEAMALGWLHEVERLRDALAAADGLRAQVLCGKSTAEFYEIATGTDDVYLMRLSEAVSIYDRARATLLAARGEEDTKCQTL